MYVPVDDVHRMYVRHSLHQHGEEDPRHLLREVAITLVCKSRGEVAARKILQHQSCSPKSHPGRKSPWPLIYIEYNV